MTSSVVTGDCVSQKTWYFHRTTVKRGIWHLGDEPGCLADRRHCQGMVLGEKLE